MQPDVDAIADAVLDAVDRAMRPVVDRLTRIEGAVDVVQGRVADLARTVAADHDTTVALGARGDDVGAVVAGALAPLTERVVTLDARLGVLAGVPDAIAAVRERIAGVEARPPVPGPTGAAGADGRDGLDGLGFDDLTVDDDGDRTITIRFTRGDVVKAFPVALPVTRYRGVFQAGASYARGDVVTWGGSMWHCDAPTTSKPDDRTTGWTLAVKCGRPGKDGATGPAGPRGRDWDQVFDAARGRG